MSNDAAQDTPTSTQAVKTPSTTSTKPTWLKSLEKMIEDSRDDDFDDEHCAENVRDLLLAPEEDAAAVPNAVARFMQYYKDGSKNERLEMRQPPKYGARYFEISIGDCVIAAVKDISPSDPKQERLLDLLVGIRDNSAPEKGFEYNPDDPVLVFYGDGILHCLSEAWQDYIVDESTKDSPYRTALEACKYWINLNAFIAKAFQAGMVAEKGPSWISTDFRDTFPKEGKRNYDFSTNIGRKTQVISVANQILIAGEALVKEFKKPSRKWPWMGSPDVWKRWALTFREVVEEDGAGSDDPYWDLKTKAQQAYDKMVDLYPELFDEELKGEAKEEAKEEVKEEVKEISKEASKAG